MELFEVQSPGGDTEILSKFEDGLVSGQAMADIVMVYLK